MVVAAATVAACVLALAPGMVWGAPCNETWLFSAVPLAEPTAPDTISNNNNQEFCQQIAVNTSFTGWATGLSLEWNSTGPGGFVRYSLYRGTGTPYSLMGETEVVDLPPSAGRVEAPFLRPVALGNWVGGTPPDVSRPRSTCVSLFLLLLFC
jgi:hypothetical protein